MVQLMRRRTEIFIFRRPLSKYAARRERPPPRANPFNEAVLFFPLLLIAMEELMLNHCRGGFALAAAACALVNYYFFFGEVLF